jgi:hypothetical protein
VETTGERAPEDVRAEERLAVRLLFGPSLPEGGAYVLREGYPGTAFLVGPELPDLIAGGHYRFKRRVVFDADFLKMEPVRLRRERAGEEPLETRWSSDGWTNGVDDGAVEAVVLKVTGLAAARWVGPVSGREEELGLGEGAALRMGVWLRDVVHPGEEPREFGVVVGKETEGGRFARGLREGKPEPDFFVLDENTYEVLSRDLR